MQYQTIDRAKLQQKMASHVLDNKDPASGLALVNVLDATQFERKHIPRSINIPVDELDQFEERFAKEKDIIVYCASSDCDASPRAAKALSERGFTKVFDYEGGVADWEEGHLPMAGSAATLSRTLS